MSTSIGEPKPLRPTGTQSMALNCPKCGAKMASQGQVQKCPSCGTQVTRKPL